MPGNAVVGALRVNLGLNSAEFQQGLKRAQSGMKKFGKDIALGAAALTAAFAAAGATLGVFVKDAIDHFDELSKTAQKVGLTVEALSQLEYAAKLSDVSLEGLATGLRKLSQNMTDVASGAGATAKRGFDILGISLKDTDGSLKGTQQVLNEVADRFASMPDGVEKTAAAVAIFGRAGADMIPLLNGGSAGLKQMADEADRLGQTISTSAAHEAEAFNDTITRLQSALGGIVNKIAIGVLPALQSIATTVSDPAFIEAISGFINLIAQGIAGIAQVAAGTLKALGDLWNAIDARLQKTPIRSASEKQLQDALASNNKFLNHGDGTLSEQQLDQMRKQNDAIEAELARRRSLTASGAEPVGAGPGSFEGMLSQFGVTPPAISAPTVPVYTPTKFDFGSTTDAASKLNDVMAEGKRLFEDTRTPAEAYNLEIQHLNELLEAGAIDQDTYNRAVVQAQEGFDRAAESADKMGRAAEDAARTAGEGLRGLIDGTETWNEALADVLESLARIVFQNINFGGGTGGKLLEGLFGGLFGFKDGGSILPGGLGGVDSQVVAFRKSPSEQVDIYDPKKVRGDSSGLSLHISNVVNGSGLSPEQMADALVEANRRTLDSINAKFPDAVLDVQRNRHARGKKFF